MLIEPLTLDIFPCRVMLRIEDTSEETQFPDGNIPDAAKRIPSRLQVH